MPEKTVSTAAKPAQARGKGGVKSLKQWSVPIFFLVLSIAGIIAAGLDINFLIHEITARFGRNMLLVLSLLIPVMAGLGLNF